MRSTVGRFAKLFVIGSLFCVVALMPVKGARASGSGPIIKGVGPGAALVGGPFELAFVTLPDGTDPYVALQVEVVYDSSLVSVTSIDASPTRALWAPPGSCDTVKLADSMGGLLAPPLQAFVFACAGLSGTTTTGLPAFVHLQALNPGQAVFHMVTPGAPDNGGPAFGTYTGNAGDFTVQANTLQCGGHCTGPDIVVDIGGTPGGGGISGSVSRSTPAISPVANAAVTLCLHGLSTGCQSTTANASGEYQFNALLPVAYDVVARDPGTPPYIFGTIGPVNVGGSLISGQDIVIMEAPGGISGHVVDDVLQPVTGAYVSVCQTSGGPCATAVAADGSYALASLAAGTYIVTAFPPVGISNSITVAVSGTVVLDQDIGVHLPTPLPPGTTIEPSTISGGLPRVNWNTPLTLTASACPGGSATYTVTQSGTTVMSGPLAEVPAGTYVAAVPAFAPTHGNAHIEITVVCPGGGGTTVIAFDLYIDPSGIVQDTAGNPISDATARLLRADTPAGPFAAVPDGSAIMSPGNRSNPDVTDSQGRFGWDVVAGFYVVEVPRPGCASATDPSEAVARTAILTIPPPVTDLVLTLDCGDNDMDGYVDAREVGIGENPYSYCTIMRADVNGSSKADLADLIILAGWYNKTIPPAPARYDQNASGKIQLSDLIIAAGVYGKLVTLCP